MGTPITNPRTLRILVGVATLGVVALLLGLAWDAHLHASNPHLAESESIFSLSNPGHALAGAGVVLIATGVMGSLWTVWFRHQARLVRAMGAVTLIIVTLAAGGAVLATNATAEGGHRDELDGHHSRDYDELWNAASARERAGATKLVEDTKKATVRYASYEAALAAGYRPNPRAGARATHHPNPALMRDGKVLDPAAPESLVYWTGPDGRKVLVGVVYKAGPGEPAPAPGGELTAWHTHAGGKKCYPALDEDCPQDTTRMLHVFFFDGVHDPFTESMVAAAGGRDAFARAMQKQLSAAGGR